MTALEVVGKQLDGLSKDYDALLGLVARMASGEVEPSRVSVDLLGRSWTVAPAVLSLDGLAARAEELHRRNLSVG